MLLAWLVPRLEYYLTTGANPLSNLLQQLYTDYDQSPWLDFIDRDLLSSGRLLKLAQAGVRGVTSNPTIFAKAIDSGQYDRQIQHLLARGASDHDIYEHIVIGEVAAAADVLRPVYEQSGGRDGFVSIEVEADLAHDAARTLARAIEFSERLARPNVMVKIPATDAGLEAITEATARGLNINVTLLFSLAMYRRVAEAYIEGLRRRAEAGHDLTYSASVASFFVSRVDKLVDARLDKIGDETADLRGRAAIANARAAYRAFGEIFSSTQFAELQASGARPQRLLWASTSVKDPDRRDVTYVEELIGPQTISTMPLETMEALNDHGVLAARLDIDARQDEELLERLRGYGIELEEVAEQLTVDGIAQFADSFNELLTAIAQRRGQESEAIA